MELEVNKSIFSDFDDLFTSIRCGHIAGSVVLPSGREGARMSPGAGPDVLQVIRSENPGSSGSQPVGVNNSGRFIDYLADLLTPDRIIYFLAELFTSRPIY